MKQIILYDSATGNTEYLAKALSHALPNVPCGPVGSLDCSKAELVYLGFWTDKGTCSDRLRAVLPSLAGKQIFLFGTAGFGADQAYFSQIIRRLEGELPQNCTVIGWYMCPGRMGEGVSRRYEAMLQDPVSAGPAELLLKNFDAVRTRPDAVSYTHLDLGLVLGLELAGQLLQVISGELHVLGDAALLLHLVDELLKVLLAHLHDHVGVHLDKAAVAVPGPAGVVGLLGLSLIHI